MHYCSCSFAPHLRELQETQSDPVLQRNKKCQDRGKKTKKTSQTIVVWNFDIHLQAEYPPAHPPLSLALTVMLQPVSSLIKSHSNTNKCQHLKAAHSTISYLHDMWSLNLIETQRARRPRTNLLGWRFNQKYLISYLSIGDVFLQSFFFFLSSTLQSLTW